MRDLLTQVVEEIDSDKDCTIDMAYNGCLTLVGEFADAINKDRISSEHFEKLFFSLMILDRKTDPEMKVEQIIYVIDQVGVKKPAFNMVSHIVDKINSVGLHDATGLHTIVYSYLSQSANFYNFSLKECIN